MSAQRFGRFWLHDKIGIGGSSEIFRATIGPDAETYAFELALKRLHPKTLADPSKMKQFYSEAELGKLLHHPNVVKVYESGIQEQYPYLVMEYIWGMDLAHLIELLRRRRLILPCDLAIYITLQAIRALDYIHTAYDSKNIPQDITHADVTPSNIFITYDGLVKIGDFGIAQYIHGRNFNVSFFEGKIKYMPPEIWKGQQVNQTVDLWSITACLYEMITAKSLYEHIPEQQLLQTQKIPDIPLAHTINETVPLSISKLIATLLHPKKSKRPNDAATLYRLLKHALNELNMKPDANGLSKFVRAGTQFQGASPQQINNEVFQSNVYTAPFDISPTQRYELKQKDVYKKKQYKTAAMAVFILMLTIFLGISLFKSYETKQERKGIFTKEIEQYNNLIQSGYLALNKQDIVHGENCFQKALAIFPEGADAQWGLAKIDYLQQKWDSSQNRLLAILHKSPNNQEAYCLLGKIYQKTNRTKQANEILQRCTNKDKANAESHISTE